MAIGWPCNMGGQKPLVEFYACECKQCGFSQKYEVSHRTTIQIEPPDSDDPLLVSELPGNCPKCGARWRGRKIPSFVIRNT